MYGQDALCKIDKAKEQVVDKFPTFCAGKDHLHLPLIRPILINHTTPLFDGPFIQLRKQFTQRGNNTSVLAKVIQLLLLPEKALVQLLHSCFQLCKLWLALRVKKPRDLAAFKPC